MLILFIPEQLQECGKVVTKSVRSLGFYFLKNVFPSACSTFFNSPLIFSIGVRRETSCKFYTIPALIYVNHPWKNSTTLGKTPLPLEKVCHRWKKSSDYKDTCILQDLNFKQVLNLKKSKACGRARTHVFGVMPTVLPTELCWLTEKACKFWLFYLKC